MMKLSRDDRNAIARAIHGNVTGETDFGNRSHSANLGPRMLAWATRLQIDSATEGDLRAIRYIACLPYTQPCIDDTDESEEAAMAAFLLAMFKASGFSLLHFPNVSATEAYAAIGSLIM
jgi:hypothetical protein